MDDRVLSGVPRLRNRARRGRALGLAAAVLAIAARAHAQEGEGSRPTVIVTDAGGKAFAIATQEFAGSGGADAAKLRADIGAALDFSSVFRSLDPAAFLGPRQTAALSDSLDCGSWRQIGADAFLEGVASGSTIEVKAWDVARCRTALSRSYRVGGDPRRTARRIADDVVEAFTGRRGVASTEITYVSSQSGHPEIQVMDADGGSQRAATRNKTINAFPAWSPDGNAIVYMSYVYRRSPHLFRIVRGGTEQPGRLLQSLDATRAVYRGVYAPNGTRLAAVISVDGAPEIFTVDVDGRNLRRLTNHKAIDVSPTWSPDGARIAFVSDRTGAPQVYVMNADGSGQRRLTFEGSYNTSPAWSPDGRWIAYETRVGGEFDLWLIDPEGSTNAPLVTNPRTDESPSWAPDSRKIAFHSARRGKKDIYIVDLDGQNARRLTEGAGENTQPCWGPYPR
jgi:TolB protein